MKAKAFLPKFGLVFVSTFLVMSCRLPGMIPLTPIPSVPMPVMEKNAETLIEKLTRDRLAAYLQVAGSGEIY